MRSVRRIIGHRSLSLGCDHRPGYPYCLLGQSPGRAAGLSRGTVAGQVHGTAGCSSDVDANTARRPRATVDTPHRRQPAPTPTRAPLPPTVVSIKPDRGQEQVISAPVVVTFDQPMDPASTSSAFSIEPKVPGEVKVSGNALTFSPTERLERNKEYRVTLAANAASATGLDAAARRDLQVHHGRLPRGQQHAAGRRRERRIRR